MALQHNGSAGKRELRTKPVAGGTYVKYKSATPVWGEGRRNDRINRVKLAHEPAGRKKAYSGAGKRKSFNRGIRGRKIKEVGLFRSVRVSKTGQTRRGRKKDPQDCEHLPMPDGTWGTSPDGVEQCVLHRAEKFLERWKRHPSCVDD